MDCFVVVELCALRFNACPSEVRNSIHSLCVCLSAAGTRQWRVASAPSRDELAMIRDLEPGRKYDMQVVTRSDLGESFGVMQVIVAGTDPGA